MAIVVNARNIRTGWGVCAPSTGSSTNIASALSFLGTRNVRLQFDGDTSGGALAIQQALVSGGAADPNLRLNRLLNGYIQSASTNTWNNQQVWLQNDYNNTGPNGRSILWAIEGPNEMNSTYTGGGCRAPNGTTLIGSGANTSDDSAADANLVNWASVVATYVSQKGWTNVEKRSGSVLYYYASNWSSNLNCSQYVDYGTVHYYAGINGTNGTPSYGPNPDNWANYYGYAQAGLCPGKQLVQTESGASTQTGGGYGQDGRSQARYMLYQILDHHARGGHSIYIYNLFNNPGSNVGSVTNYNEDNFGLYYGDQTTKKQAATALHNLANLLSIGNDYTNSANFTDTATFTPAYTGANLSVVGLTDAGASGSTMVLPKSDGSTMIVVWNEPTIDTGSGTSSSIADNNITVNFGSTQTYKVYDVMGGGNANAFTATTNAASSPIVNTTTGSSVALTLRGNPLFIELTGQSAPTLVPGAPVLTKGLTTSTEQSFSVSVAANQPAGTKVIVTRVS